MIPTSNSEGPPPPELGTPLLAVSELRTAIATRRGTAPVVNGVSFVLRPRQTLGVVGESGCGKTMMALSIMRLLDARAKISGGHIRLKGRDLLALSEREMCTVRGREMSMVFQEPMTALNPVRTAGDQVMEGLKAHGMTGRRELLSRTTNLFEDVGIPAPEVRMSAYPHRLSGGLRQRVMIASALALDPEVLIADEPTTALDVTIQAQILDLMRGLIEDRGTALLLVTHDIGVIAEMADDVIVMYGGRVVESGPMRAVLEAPRHPYAVALLETIPSLRHRGERLKVIPGIVPDALHLPSGCPFRTRCRHRMPICETAPPLVDTGDGVKTRCWLFADGGDGDSPDE